LNEILVYQTVDQLVSLAIINVLRQYYLVITGADSGDDLVALIRDVSS
jgi:hypothetical protein